MSGLKFLDTELKDLKNLSCEDTDAVVELMHQIALDIEEELQDSYIYDRYFRDSSRYVRKEELDSLVEWIVHKSGEDGTSSFDCIFGYLNEIKSNECEWYYFNNNHKTHYNIKVGELRKDKKEFIDDVQEILKG